MKNNENRNQKEIIKETEKNAVEEKIIEMRIQYCKRFY